MNKQKDNTEERILDAATDIFMVKGMEGARMQEIADKASINKALLHYYFRSKDKLFDAILTKILNFAFPQIGKVLFSDLPFLERVEQVIDIYMTLLLKHQQLPAFLIKEMNREGSVLFKFIEKQHFAIQPILKEIQDAMDRGEIIQMKPEHLVVNVLGMCVFPFAARPMIKNVALNGRDDLLNGFLEQRRFEVKTFIIRAIQPQ
ncbi:TetR/AcrR family transcriptional regulator [Sunxiuqinia indica]|uniref:TetR/AcrR family transcriptional regulator n=1 Tax=Sunxiuqinia indica TaxID=2692584 RepID=UPI0013568C8E|nr:TetR/AcrR family transcriptional regulator [Sunxiuqinia indica]